MDIKQYIQNGIDERKGKTKNGFHFYRMFGSRLADERTVERYKDNIVASLENDFGYAFILRGKIGYFCFTLLKDGFEYHYRNRLVRWQTRYYEHEKEFLEKFGDKFTYKNEEEYSRMENAMAMKSLGREK